MGYEDELDKAHQYAERVRQRRELKEIRHSNDAEKKPLSFSKKAVIFIFANFVVIELYSMVVMVVFHDLTTLGYLVTAVIGQCVTAIGYFIKSRAENCANGIVYETAMYELKETALPLEESIEEVKEEEFDDGAVG